MRIAVCVKWVPDPEYPLQAGPTGVSLDTPGLTYMVSPVDMVACEAAVQLKEATAATVGLFTAGSDDSEAGLRAAFALGADEATRVAFDDSGLSGGVRAGRLLAAAIGRDAADFVICGSRSSDSGSGAVPATIAEVLGMPLVTNVVSIRGKEALEVERRLSGGRRQVVRVQAPAVLTVEESLCEPRYPSVVARRRADRAEISVRTAAALGIDMPTPALMLVRLQGPRPLSARLVAPPPEMGARQRLAYVLAGGPDQKRASSRLEGPAAAQADQLVAFLRANGALARVN